MREKLKNGKRGEIWRLPPSIGGHTRSPLPRFTVLSEQDGKNLYQFFMFGEVKYSVWLYQERMCLSQQNTFLSHILCTALVDAGWEKRGEIVRLVQTLRSGDRPKNAEEEFSEVTVMFRTQNPHREERKMSGRPQSRHLDR